MTRNDITYDIVDAAYKVHTKLGPGLLEAIYEFALARELTKKGLTVRQQQPIPVVYDGVPLPKGFVADLIVENEIIVEIKATEGTAAVHKRQLLTYLRLTNKRLGLLINFNVLLIKDGICRIAN